MIVLNRRNTLISVIMIVNPNPNNDDNDVAHYLNYAYLNLLALTMRKTTSLRVTQFNSLIPILRETLKSFVFLPRSLCYHCLYEQPQRTVLLRRLPMYFLLVAEQSRSIQSVHLDLLITN